MAGTRSRIAASTALAALVCVAAISSRAGSSANAATPVGSGDGGVVLKHIDDFASPVYVTSAPGHSNRRLLFVVEQGGTIRVLRRNRTLPVPFLDITNRVLSGGERGLLSLAFDPDYEQNRLFYVYFTATDGAIRVSQFRRSRESKTFSDPSSGRLVIRIPHADAGNHNGGQVAAGPDGNLWLATGDGGSACDPPENAQNPDSLLGKLLRIDPNGHGGYKIPASNPFVGTPGADEIYALGLRNPFRFSFDPQTNTVAIADVGQNAFEEIDYETLAGARGANFGWDALEGDGPLVRSPVGACGSDSDTPIPAHSTGPIHTYPHSGAGFTGCAVIGGMVVRDPDLPSLYGRYVYSDNCNGQLRSLVPSIGSASDDSDFGLSVTQPSSFGTDRHNHIYVTSLQGPVYRIEPTE